ncbi:nitrilase-related carbon-nitrogen hydrolase [Halomarina oriensis]|uniref:Carbon-nitrogen hydrolase family protein n=1 Tax=Halomarina oriensis TaxID=671145 RepID=A0A6B0GGL2_9EURY|nr:carbon-nitrogen hydrolase family protein [Halomarina oriensis]
MSTPVRAAISQCPVDDLDVAANLDRLRRRVDALPDDVELAVFPETSLTGYVPDERVHEVALDRDGPELDSVRTVAREHDCRLLVGFVERGDEAVYNAAAWVAPDRTTVYRKRHLWGSERDWLTPGEERVTVETPVGTAALLTCYDLNFVAESYAHLDESVTALLVPGAWPPEHDANWRLLARARALDGVRWVLAAGRTGTRDVPDAPPAAYNGRSLVVRPDGTVAAAADRTASDLLPTLDPVVLDRCRETVGLFER